MNRRPICELSFEELSACLRSVGEASFRAAQIFEWVYQKNVQSFEAMRNVPSALRERLMKDFMLSHIISRQKQVAADGTTKVLFGLSDGETVETVMIPSPGRTTLCVSTQAGCKFG